MLDYHQISILIIEDDKHTRAPIRRMLLQLGIRSIAETEDGRSGYAELLRTRPDLVSCDVHMEPVDGRAFLKQLREAKLPGIAHTPVVFLTGDAQRDTVLFAKEHAINGYLVKPVSLNGLKSRIDSALTPAS
jgi:two-component system, chemotaxis family, chemotaxis protein CheY